MGCTSSFGQLFILGYWHLGQDFANRLVEMLDNQFITSLDFFVNFVPATAQNFCQYWQKKHQQILDKTLVELNQLYKGTDNTGSSEVELVLCMSLKVLRSHCQPFLGSTLQCCLPNAWCRSANAISMWVPIAESLCPEVQVAISLFFLKACGTAVASGSERSNPGTKSHRSVKICGMMQTWFVEWKGTMLCHRDHKK